MSERNKGGRAGVGRPGGGRSARGRPRALLHPKGRQVDVEALDSLRALLGDAPRRRDLLIEHLHAIQGRFGCLSPKHLVALAHEMRLSVVEIYETATFYAHFDVLRDDEVAPPAITVRVCDSVTCEMLGAEALIEALETAFGDGADGGKVRVLRAPCMGGCDRAPVAAIGHNQIDRANAAAVMAAVAARRTAPEIPAYIGLKAYMAAGGYGLLRDCQGGGRDAETIIASLDDAGLRGLGGAGFPAGRKWRILRDQPAPRLMAVNADEGEPGTFKDRALLESDPHRFLEGMLIAAWAVEAQEIYIYLRDEYPAARIILEREIKALEAAGLVAPGRVHLRRGAGAYICGEESAMLESIEGKRGLPRHKPPYPAEIGLFGRPTLIHNVETLHWVRELVERGPGWFTGQGRQGRQGLRRYSVSGRVREPGVKLAPAGISVRQLIAEYCGGMAAGHVFKGYLPGGASGGILPASLDDVPLDFGTLEEYGCIIGSAAVIVLSQADNVADVARNLLRFFEDESCGQCTPCRAGCEKALALMGAPVWDRELLGELSGVMADASICGLGQAAPNGLMSVLRHFPDDVPQG
jgi:formate dehydrogenase beta subunit